MTVNYYEILEIPSDADEREIKRAYHRIARDMHPDKAASPEDARSLEEKFALVSAAYNTLKDAEKRGEYDKTIRKNGHRSKEKPATAARSPITSVLSAGRGVPSSRKADGSQGQNRPVLGITPEKIAIAQKAFAKGMQCFKEDNFTKAIEFFNAAIQNNDTEAVYFSRLALALIQAKKSAAKAIDAAQKAIEMDPYNIEHKFNLAFIFETIGSKTNSKRIYEDILRWDAGNTRALSALATMSKKKSAFSFGGASSGISNAEKSGFLDKILARFRK